MDIFEGIDLGSSMSSFKSSTNSAMLNVKDKTLAPADVTSTRMKEGVALKTSRDVGVKDTITSYRSAAVEQLDGIIGALSGGLLNTKDITKAIRIGQDGVTFNEDSIVNAIGRDAGVNIRGTSGIMRQLKKEIVGEFHKLTGFNIDGLITADGERMRITKNWRGNAGKEILKMVGKTAGFDEFLDVSIRGAFYNGTLFNAATYGMSGSYGKLFKAYPKGFELIRRDAIMDAMRIVISNGDIESVDKLTELLDKEGKNVLLSRYPNFVELLFSNFRFDRDMFPEQYPALQAKLLRLLNDLIGPNWYMKYTEFGQALNLAIIQKVSKDMKVLLSSWDEIVPLLCTAGMFSDSPATKELRTHFKDAPKYDF